MAMDFQSFISKWKKCELKERSASQEHFIDLCRLFGHQTPAEVDPAGEIFTFEKGASKQGGGEGWADVWKKDFFGWEYKGKHKDLDVAYNQLLLYRDSIGNPPLLVVSDIERIIIHTNFTGTVSVVHSIELDKIAEPRNREILEQLFFDPEKLRPGRTSEAITRDAAATLAEIAQSMSERGLDPYESAHFLNRLVFCLFSEDIGLLPDQIFSKILDKCAGDGAHFSKMLSQLFEVMAKGGDFGFDTIRHFNGSLFDNAKVMELTNDELDAVRSVSKLDWSFIEPSIIGTLFERGLDPAKRSQLGAQYTGRADIELVIDNIIMKTLRKEWDDVRNTAINLLSGGDKSSTGKVKKPSSSAFKKAKGEADLILHRFLQKLGSIKILDPACGSGNFLYVALQKLKELEKAVLLFAIECEFGGYIPVVHPWQMFGIEINPYAYELAQTTVWIGYLQWVKFNGFGIHQDPILQPMDKKIRRMDSILDLSDPEKPKEPEWPAVDFIIGNPPFLGGKLLRKELGDAYMDKLIPLWKGRVPAEADLCCYWFEKARSHIENGKCRRAGLLATQGIRGGANREVLKRIKESGNIFFAESDRPWILNGANVHISIIGFDSGAEEEIILDGKPVPKINANLTSTADISDAKRLTGNMRIAFMGTTKQGAFEIPGELARKWLELPNPNGRPNSDVLFPWKNGNNIVKKNENIWIIDFYNMNEEDAAKYEAPFEYLVKNVKTVRESNHRSWFRKEWWQFYAQRPEMRKAIAKQCKKASYSSAKNCGQKDYTRYLVTPRVSKYRLFSWLYLPTNPDSALIAFARSDYSFFGILQSRIHEIWALKLGTRLETRPRYTPTSCFETFPFPNLNPASAEAISTAARNLDDLRMQWLNPPEWTREEIIEFPATVGGPWTEYILGIENSGFARNQISEPDVTYDSTIEEFHSAESNVRSALLRNQVLKKGDIASAKFAITVPKDANSAKKLRGRTLTALYNERPAWLDMAHRLLDKAVFAAYGLPPDLSDEEIMEKLLAINVEEN